MAFFMQNLFMSTKCRALNVGFVELFLTFLQRWSILQFHNFFYLTYVCCAVIWPISSLKRIREDLKFGLHKEENDDTGTAFCMQNLFMHTMSCTYFRFCVAPKPFLPFLQCWSVLQSHGTWPINRSISSQKRIREHLNLDCTRHDDDDDDDSSCRICLCI
jgi:hypothetical protein